MIAAKPLFLTLMAAILAPALHPSRAAYTLELLAGGGKELAVERGAEFELTINLTGGTGDQHNAGVIGLTSTAPGLLYQSYQWSPPFSPGGIDDDSKPRLTDLPVLLDAETLSAPGYPAGVIDFELSNVSEQTFSSGLLVTMTFTVPHDYAGPETVTLTVSEAAFSLGFQTVPAQADGPVEISIVPASFETWINAYFPMGTTEAGEEADPDADGLANFAEFFFGSDPTVPTSTDELIDLRVEDGKLILAVTSVAAAPGTLLMIEKASMLNFWAGLGRGDIYRTTVVPLPGGRQRMEHDLRMADAAFFRVWIQRTSP